jgi:hypothetical protein
MPVRAHRHHSVSGDLGFRDMARPARDHPPRSGAGGHRELARFSPAQRAVPSDVLVDSWGVLPLGRGDTLASRYGSEIKAATTLWRGASRFPGAGHFSVFAEVLWVEALEDGGTEVVFKSKPDWRQLDAQGEETSAETRSIRELTWRWRGGAGPVPVAIGMRVDLRVTGDGKVRRIGYTFDEIRACRRAEDDRWELVLMIAEVKEIGQKGRFLRVLPQAFNPVASEVRWTEAHGLCVGSFADGEYGAADTEETETLNMRRAGWPIANEPGTRILVGREGWRRWDQSAFFETGNNLHWLAAAAPPRQWLLSDEDAALARKLPASPPPAGGRQD